MASLNQDCRTPRIRITSPSGVSSRRVGRSRRIGVGGLVRVGWTGADQVGWDRRDFFTDGCGWMVEREERGRGGGSGENFSGSLRERSGSVGVLVRAVETVGIAVGLHTCSLHFNSLSLLCAILTS